jgi:hypothetical protein
MHEENETLIEVCRRLQAKVPQVQRNADRAGERAQQLRDKSRAACERAMRSLETARRLTSRLP